MVNKVDDEYEVKIIDLGHADYDGGQPYKNTPLDVIRNHPQLDPALANGGPCSMITDLYSLGHLMQRIYKK